MIRTIVGCLVTALLLHASGTAIAQAPQLLPPAPGTQPTPPGGTTRPPPPAPSTSPFALDVEGLNPVGAPVLTRPDDGVLKVGVIFSGKAATSASVAISQFVSDSGGSIVVPIVDCANASASKSTTTTVSVTPNGTAPICLSVPSLAANSRYNGRLTLTAADMAPLLRTIVILPPTVATGTLALDHLTVTQTVELPLSPWSDSADPDTILTLFEKSGKVPLDGLSVRLEQLTAPAGGFSLFKNVTFSATPAEDNAPNSSTPSEAPATSSKPANEMSLESAGRRLEPGHHLDVRIRFKDLQPGDYSAVLHFVATNSADDAGQKLQLNLHVRDSKWWAIMCMILALIISFIATKILASERRRAAILQRVDALQPGWFAALPPVLAVVWVEAVLHKAKRLSKRFFLTSPDLIEASVASVTGVLGVLDTARQLRDRLSLALDALVFQRAASTLERVTARIGAGHRTMRRSNGSRRTSPCSKTG